MPHGYPDYWQQATPGLPVPGQEQTLWIDGDTQEIAGGANASLVDYTVPAGEVLYIYGGHVSCDGPGIHRWFHMIDLGLGIDHYFDTSDKLPFNPSAIRAITAGQRIRFACRNDDDVAHNFQLTVYGARVTIVSDNSPSTGVGLLIPNSGV